jgi:hypothetical protein
MALTTEGTPCAVPEFTPAERAAALKQALIRCWSVVNPGPDGGDAVCSVRPVQFDGVIFVRPGGGGCGDPAALTTDDQCLPKAVDPEDVATALLGARPPLGVIVVNGGPPIPPGPPPPAR